jgi:hypothetical protein
VKQVHHHEDMDVIAEKRILVANQVHCPENLDELIFEKNISLSTEQSLKKGFIKKLYN